MSDKDVRAGEKEREVSFVLIFYPFFFGTFFFFWSSLICMNFV